MRLAVIIGALCLAAIAPAALRAHEHFRVVGVITKLSTTEMDVKNREGKTYTVDINKKTVVKRGKEKDELGLSALKVGQSVVVDAYGDDEFDLEALDVRIVPPIAPPSLSTAQTASARQAQPR
jgi:hypothetical protein